MFCFVILHYISLEETTAFVENIQDRVKGDKEIIIVDNASPNGSGKALLDLYDTVPNVTVLLNHKNEGFAKGNNRGYQYAKEHFNPKFIAIANNDIELPQSDFIELVEKIYEEEDFAVLGPQIYSTNEKRYQSPKRLTLYSKDEVEREYENYKKKRDSKYIVPLRAQLKRWNFLKFLVHKRRERFSPIDVNKSYTNPIIHGSFLIVSEKFIAKRDVAFYDKTYMYFETEILAYQCEQLGLKVIYSPKIKVLHHHSISTRKTLQNELKKVRFMNNAICDSLERYLELLEEDGQQPDLTSNIILRNK